MNCKRLICCICLTILTYTAPSMMHNQTIRICNAAFDNAVFDKLKPTDWQIFTQAIAWQESRWIDNAVGSANDLGYLQITPIYVKEVNRLLAKRKSDVRYSLEDRLDRQKSIEMFNIMQDHYNPKHDKALAIALHNPKAGKSYKTNIMNKYAELLKEQ